MKDLYTIENRTFRISITKLFDNSYIVCLNTYTGGEFKVNFSTYQAATKFFDEFAESIYSYDH